MAKQKEILLIENYSGMNIASLEFPLLGSSIIDFISSNPILQSPIAELGEGKIRILQSPIAQLDNPVIPTEKLFNCLSYPHICCNFPIRSNLNNS